MNDKQKLEIAVKALKKVQNVDWHGDQYGSWSGEAYSVADKALKAIENYRAPKVKPKTTSLFPPKYKDIGPNNHEDYCDCINCEQGGK